MDGHGIGQQRETLEGPLADIRIKPEPTGSAGSFARLSQMLDSPLWSKGAPVRLTELWDCIPENATSPIGANTRRRRTPLYADIRSLAPEPDPLVSVPVVGVPSWVFKPQLAENLQKYFQAFPEACKYDGYHKVRADSGYPPDFSRQEDGWGELTMSWQLPSGQDASVHERRTFLEAISRRYCGRRLFIPAVAGTTRSMHPLMAWWAVLHTLSILARYHPAAWAQHINVDASAVGVPIERLLREALTVLPSLIVEAIDQVSA